MAALVWSQFSSLARHFAPSIDTPIKSFGACLWARLGTPRATWPFGLLLSLLVVAGASRLAPI